MSSSTHRCQLIYFHVCSQFDEFSFAGPLGASPEPICKYFSVIVHDDNEVPCPCPRTNLVGGGSGASSVYSCARLKAKTTTKQESASSAFATSPNEAGPGGTSSWVESSAVDVSVMVGTASLKTSMWSISFAFVSSKRSPFYLRACR